MKFNIIISLDNGFAEKIPQPLHKQMMFQKAEAYMRHE